MRYRIEGGNRHPDQIGNIRRATRTGQELILLKGGKEERPNTFGKDRSYLRLEVSLSNQEEQQGFTGRIIRSLNQNPQK